MSFNHTSENWKWTQMQEYIGRKIRSSWLLFWTAQSKKKKTTTWRQSLVFMSLWMGEAHFVPTIPVWVATFALAEPDFLWWEDQWSEDGKFANCKLQPKSWFFLRGCPTEPFALATSEGVRLLKPAQAAYSLCPSQPSFLTSSGYFARRGKPCTGFHSWRELTSPRIEAQVRLWRTAAFGGGGGIQLPFGPYLFSTIFFFPAEPLSKLRCACNRLPSSAAVQFYVDSALLLEGVPCNKFPDQILLVFLEFSFDTGFKCFSQKFAANKSLFNGEFSKPTQTPVWIF